MIIKWATSTDVKRADLGGVTADIDDDRIEYWLERASRAILDAVPDLEDRVFTRVVSKDAPSDVQIDLVLSKLANPRGIRTVQQTDGPTSGSVTFGGDAPGQLVLTDKQIKALGGRASRRRAAGTVTTW